MIISRDSWHYKLLNKFDFRIPSSLCPYFWKVVLCVGLSIILGVVLIAFAFAIIHGIGYATFFKGVSFFDLTLWQHIQCVLYSLLIDLCIVITVCSGFYILSKSVRSETHEFVYESKLFAKIRKYEDYNEYLKANKKGYYKERKPGILLSYLKAKKEKVCPTLEFK